MSAVRSTAIAAREAMNTPGGSGVARRRLRTPRSRCSTMPIASATKAAAITPSAMIPGT